MFRCSFPLKKTWTLIGLMFIFGMNSVLSIRNPGIRGSQKSNETTLIVLSAPSVGNNYYQAVFSQIIEYMINFAQIVHGKDEIVILADAATLPYFQGKVADDVLVEANIEDIWIRDFSPVIPSKQIKFRYLPDYQSKSIATFIDLSFEKWLSDNNLNYKRKSHIILDGGNVVDSPDGSRVIVTDRILKDNPQLTKAQASAELKYIMDADQVAIIPELPGDTTGHADGMLMWVDNNRILLQETDEPERTKVINALKKAFPDVDIIEIPDYYKYASWKGFISACNVFVNSIVTDQHIYMPTFNDSHDLIMYNLIQSYTSKKVIRVPAEKVCFMGGSVRCLSWQAKGELKTNILKLTKQK